jgi:hypothetical protein
MLSIVCMGGSLLVGGLYMIELCGTKENCEQMFGPKKENV